MESLQRLKNQQIETKNMNYQMSPQVNSKLNLEKEIDSLLKKDTRSVKIFGICGGSSCGKSKITKYFQNKIRHSIVIAEKDFLKKPVQQRKKSYHDDKENLFAVSNEQDGYSKERKEKLIELNDPDFYEFDRLSVCFYLQYNINYYRMRL